MISCHLQPLIRVWHVQQPEPAQSEDAVEVSKDWPEWWEISLHILQCSASVGADSG